MKKIILSILTIFALATIFTGCDKPPYKHPMHRE
jgi:predicted small lipoprotein YifL